MTLIYFIILLSVIIIIHECGHLIAAKIFGVYCYEFSIGMGPKLFQKKGKETNLTIRALPIGGFVAMAGDTDNELETKVDVEVPIERTLKGISLWKKIIIMLAGVTMNFLLALVIIASILLYNGTYAISPAAEVKEVMANSVAQEAGFQSGDVIEQITINSSSFKPANFNEMVTFLYNYDGNGNVDFVVKRGEDKINISLKPTYDAEENRYIIGITGPSASIVKINPLNSLYYSFTYCISMLKSILFSLAQLIRGHGLDNLSGPVGIYEATGQAVSYGFTSYLLMMALISLNIGLMNALPLPILDGGRVLLAIIEAIVGHPLDEKFTNALMGASTILILFIFLFATYRDILRLF